MSGRIRTIKPEILDDDKAAALRSDTWRLWVSMWLVADDYGVFPANPKLIHSKVFWSVEPTVPVAEQLRELVEAELVELYSVRGQPFARVNGWKRHQRIDRPGRPIFPSKEKADPDAEDATPREGDASPRDTCTNLREEGTSPRVTLATDQYQYQRPPRGGDMEPPPARESVSAETQPPEPTPRPSGLYPLPGLKTLPPESFEVTESIRANCAMAGYPVPTADHVAEWRLDARKHGKVFADHNAAFLSWMAKAKRFDRERRRDGPGHANVDRPPYHRLLVVGEDP